MIIYRVEDCEGGGPYNGKRKDAVRDALPHLFCGFDECPDRHPMPHADIPNWDRYSGYHFGFASFDQLAAWFTPGERDTLRGLGFGIAVYAVPADYVMQGGRQAAFWRSKAARAAELTPLV
jgi:hypothetical protein